MTGRARKRSVWTLLLAVILMTVSFAQSGGEIPVVPGRTYEYTETFNTTVVSYLTARFTLQNGTKTYQELGSFPANSNSGSATVQFQAPANAATVAVSHGLQGFGTLSMWNGVIRDVSAPPSVFGGMVSLNFDDGWRSTYNNALPMLDAAGFKSSNYIITGRFGYPDYVGPNEVLSMQTRGHEIGAHTRTHQDLTLMSSAQMDGEIAGSKSDLLGIGVNSVQTFAYPFGAYNGTVVQAVQNAGFIGARTTNGGYNLQNGDKFLLQRHNLGNATTIAQAKSYVDYAISNNVWLIFLAHHVDYTNTAYSVTPEFFQQLVNYLVQKKSRVVTTSQGIAMMSP